MAKLNKITFGIDVATDKPVLVFDIEDCPIAYSHIRAEATVELLEKLRDLIDQTLDEKKRKEFSREN